MSKGLTLKKKIKIFEVISCSMCCCAAQASMTFPFTPVRYAVDL